MPFRDKISSLSGASVQGIVKDEVIEFRRPGHFFILQERSCHGDNPGFKHVGEIRHGSPAEGYLPKAHVPGWFGGGLPAPGGELVHVNGSKGLPIEDYLQEKGVRREGDETLSGNAGAFVRLRKVRGLVDGGETANLPIRFLQLPEQFIV
jgi:hypothetical protein